ncbi:uncharacterized protein TNCV_2235041 [Trichonephila clavipes]|nr:uncharacterized protein TNCV_2235041 [Trichonephila clavipes]
MAKLQKSLRYSGCTTRRSATLCWVSEAPRKAAVAHFELLTGRDCLRSYLYRIGISASADYTLCHSDFDVGGTTFHSVRTRRITCVTDFNTWLVTLAAAPLGLDSNPGEDTDVCKCILPLQQGSTLNSRQAASLLVRLMDGEDRWEAPDHSQGVLPQN